MRLKNGGVPFSEAGPSLITVPSETLVVSAVPLISRRRVFGAIFTCFLVCYCRPPLPVATLNMNNFCFLLCRPSALLLHVTVRRQWPMSWITCSGFCDLHSDITAASKKHQLAPRKRGMSGSAVVLLPSAATKSSHNGPLIKKKNTTSVSKAWRTSVSGQRCVRSYSG